MKNITLFSILMLLLVACGSEPSPENIALDETPVKVQTQTISANTNNQGGNLLLHGTVAAKEQAAISTRVMGSITKVFVKEGQQVRKGQTLAQVHNVDLKAQQARIKAQIAEAKAALKNTQLNHDRFKNLYASKSITQKEYNDSEMQLEMATARVNAAEEALNELNVQLGYANISAPFSGRITKKFAQQGNMAAPGQPLFQLESSGALLVAVDVPSSEIQHLSLQDEVKLTIDDLNKQVLGKITLINPSSSNNSHHYRVEITPSNSQGMLTGMNVKVGFANIQKKQTAKQSIWIPQSAITYQGQLTGVYTVSSQKTALLRWVQLGDETSSQVEVLSGLTTEDQLITHAEGRLYNGVKITE